MPFVRTYMKPEAMRAAWSYLEHNAERLLRDRPGDEELAMELSKELGLPFTRSNARYLRVKCPITVQLPGPDGSRAVLLTWRAAGPSRSYPQRGVKPKATKADIMEAIQALSCRLTEVEVTLRTLVKALQ